jgi:hypothetical protein
LLSLIGILDESAKAETPGEGQNGEQQFAEQTPHGYTSTETLKLCAKRLN